MEQVDGGAARYRAFISYSHRDAAFGKRLHRRLESYRLPRRLVGRPGRLGPVPGGLSPIFRDREELPAAGDLSAEVRAALAASAALVVVCSPSAAASPWVSREIETFRALHPDRPVLAALVSGEPADCFPEALSAGGLEPLAADFRKEGDGPRLGLLKLAAGIAGVGLDELVQRDAQRQVASVTAITAGALTLTLVMAAMTAVALNARAEAERQRAEAEDLVDFMLTDLREKLEGVARLEVLTVVNERALAHYAGQDLKRLSPKELESRARILHAMGEDDDRRGKFERAAAQFEEARRSTAALLAADPDNVELIFAHAQSEYYAALAEWRRGRPAAAEVGFRRYAALAAKLAAADPRNPEWQMEVGYADSNLGMLALRDKNEPLEAKRLFLTSLQAYARALTAKPGDADFLRDTADGYAWLADSQRALGDYRGALASREEEARILRMLQADDPNNAGYARDLLGSTMGLARVKLKLGRTSEAYRELLAAHAEADRLARADPADEKVARQKLAIGLFLAEAALLEKRPVGEARGLIAECGKPIAVRDVELRDLCALTAAKQALAEGRRSDPSFDYLRQNRPRLDKVHRSPRWGVDFANEMPVLGKSS